MFALHHLCLVVANLVFALHRLYLVGANLVFALHRRHLLTASPAPGHSLRPDSFPTSPWRSIFFSTALA